MSVNRIQKLLFTEYNDFEDMVLIESPFAQTTRDGEGIRQVQMGLTPTKLILAMDVLQPEAPPLRTDDVDPDIECLELVSMFPVEFVNMSVFRRKTRYTLKARFCNGQIFYFELAGSYKREMFWNLWCERVRFLNPEEAKSTASETSVASSSLSLLSEKTRRQLKCTSHFAKMKEFCCANQMMSWQDRNLFLGPEYNSRPSMNKLWSPEKPLSNQTSLNGMSQASGTSRKSSQSEANKMHLVHRFGCGIEENCQANLFLPVIHDPNVPPPYIDPERREKDMAILAEEAVLAWEDSAKKQMKPPHMSKLRLIPFPLCLNGITLDNLGKPQLHNLQQKRSMSEINLNDIDPDMSLCITKRLLISSTSCHSVIDHTKPWTLRPHNNYCTQECPVTLFWTPGLFYKPYTSSSAYTELQEHLRTLQVRLSSKEKKKRRYLSSWTCKRTSDPNMFHSDIEYGSGDYLKSIEKGYRSHDDTTQCAGSKGRIGELNYMKKALDPGLVYCPWDFDSTSLAYQITLIDRDLFLKITSIEIVAVVHEKSCKNAPNLNAMILFAQRLIGLITSEIVKQDDVKLRARMIARMINVSEKLHRLHNLHSVRTIIAALQSVPVYRLKATWRYLKQHHSTKYQSVPGKICG